MVTNAPAPACLQTNTLRTDVNTLETALRAAGLEVRRHPQLADALLCEGGNPIASEAFQSGWFYVQDAAARYAVLAANLQPGMTVLDACAAPGGKSFAAAMQLRGRGSILACDMHENKLRRVREGAQRLGLTMIDTAAMDARMPDAALHGRFDVVLADVPCSGLGVIRKKPEIRYKDPAELEGLPAVQRAILDGLAPCVRPGGVLLYSTCTVRRCENEDVVRAFLQAHPDFEPEEMRTFWPHLDGTDGFFICRLRSRA